MARLHHPGCLRTGSVHRISKDNGILPDKETPQPNNNGVTSAFSDFIPCRHNRAFGEVVGGKLLCVPPTAARPSEHNVSAVLCAAMPLGKSQPPQHQILYIVDEGLNKFIGTVKWTLVALELACGPVLETSMSVLPTVKKLLGNKFHGGL